MSMKFKKSEKYIGVRYKEHPTRKNGVRKDRYFSIRYQFNGKDHEEGYGWESEGFTELGAFNEVCAIKKHIKDGSGYCSLKEKYAEELSKTEQNKQIYAEEHKDDITYDEFYQTIYKPNYAIIDGKRKESVYKFRILNSLGNIKLSKLTSLDIEKLKNKLIKEGKSPATVNNTLSMVRHMINRAIECGYFKGVNPVKMVKMLKVDNRRMRFLTKEEAKRLLDRLDMMENPQLHDMVLLSLQSGLRAGELFKLEWMDVHFETKKINIRNTKSSVNRYVHMNDTIYEMLQRRRKDADMNIPYVFHTADGKQLKEVSKHYDRVIAGLGFNKGVTDAHNKVVFHTLRHTFASWLAMAGVDIYTIKELMGHSDIKMTMRYAHLAPDKFKNAVEAVEL